MDAAAVIGPPGRDAARIAHRLGDALRLPVRSSPSEDGTAVLLLPDIGQVRGDVPFVVAVEESRVVGEARERLVEFLAAAIASRRGVRTFSGSGEARRWLDDVKYGGLAVPVGPPQRICLVSTGGEDSRALGHALASGLGVPEVEADPRAGEDRDGWGPRYAAIAREETWLVHTSDWHAVETFAEAADLVIYLEHPAKEAAAQMAAPRPESRWAALFGAWFRRYPRIEANLLHREVGRFEHAAPLLRVRTPGEARALTMGLLSPAGSRAV